MPTANKGGGGVWGGGGGEGPLISICYVLTYLKKMLFLTSFCRVISIFSTPLPSSICRPPRWNPLMILLTSLTYILKILLQKYITLLYISQNVQKAICRERKSPLPFFIILYHFRQPLHHLSRVCVKGKFH